MALSRSLTRRVGALAGLMIVLGVIWLQSVHVTYRAVLVVLSDAPMHGLSATLDGDALGAAEPLPNGLGFAWHGLRPRQREPVVTVIWTDASGVVHRVEDRPFHLPDRPSCIYLLAPGRSAASSRRIEYTCGP